MRMLLLSLVLVLTTLLTPVAWAVSKAEVALHALDYIGIDYPHAVVKGQVVSPEEYTEQLEFANQVKHLLGEVDASELVTDAQAIIDAIEKKQPSGRIQTLTYDLGQSIIQRFGILTSPRRIPETAIGARLYVEQCAACHGATGKGDGLAAQGLEPAPTDFHEWDRQSERSIYGLYSTITQGVEGTAMQAYSALNSHQRWSLAFHVSGYAFSDAQRARGEQLWKQGKRPGELSSIEKLTQATPLAIQSRLGEDGLALLAWLRAHPESLQALEPAPLETAISRMAASVQAYQKGDTKRAYQQALSAYLDGFELAESAIRASNPQLVKQVEAVMIDYRSAVKKFDQGEQVQAHYQQAVALLREAQKRLLENALSPQASFVSAMIILLREGLEAILILAAVSSVLIKSGRRDALKYLHTGWIFAIALGVVTWYLSEHVISISGASREFTEGVTALLAMVVLLYVGFWLHGKTHAVRWQQFIRDKIQKALHGGALWVLAGISFLAVYREIFETVLFYQALYQQTQQNGGAAIGGGIVAGGAALVILTWIILRTSMRLPLRLFFQVNSAIMLLLAFTFAGHGVAGLQKAGVIPVDSLPLPGVGLLGIYPTVQTLATQGVLVVLFALYLLYEHRARQRLETVEPGK